MASAFVSINDKYKVTLMLLAIGYLLMLLKINFISTILERSDIASHIL